MGIVGHGTDLIEIERIARSIGSHGDRFLNRVFTTREIEDSGDGPGRVASLAARFAAKEAALKSIGTGWSRGISWTDVETIRTPSGRPELRVRGKARMIAEDLGGKTWHVSLSHSGTHAIASVILESNDRA